MSCTEDLKFNDVALRGLIAWMVDFEVGGDVVRLRL